MVWYLSFKGHFILIKNGNKSKAVMTHLPECHLDFENEHELFLIFKKSIGSYVL